MKSIDTLKELFLNLPSRDQRALLGGGSVLLLFLAYFLIWSPVRSMLENNQKAVHDQTDLLLYVRDAEVKLMGMDNTALRKEKVNTPLELLTYIKTKLDGFSLNESLSQIKQSGDDAVSLVFKNAEFDEVLRFLIAIQNSKQIDVRQFSATALSDQGRVNADVLINLS